MTEQLSFLGQIEINYINYLIFFDTILDVYFYCDLSLVSELRRPCMITRDPVNAAKSSLVARLCFSHDNYNSYIKKDFGSSSAETFRTMILHPPCG
jgi:hypothetical protein